MLVAILGLGEAATLLARDLIGGGAFVRRWDPGLLLGVPATITSAVALKRIAGDAPGAAQKQRSTEPGDWHDYRGRHASGTPPESQDTHRVSERRTAQAMTNFDYAEFAKLGVATMYEAADKAGLIDIPFYQLIPHSRVAGPARTVRCGQDDNLMVHAAIERIRPGDIVVLTMPEPRAVALVGDLLATQMIAAGAAGVLVDAAIRDAEDLATMSLPIWTRWIRARSAAKKVVGKLDVPVSVGGATIAPDDIVVLDTDGACVIAQARADAVLAAARVRAENENNVRARYARGERSYDINDLRKIVTAGGA